MPFVAVALGGLLVLGMDEIGEGGLFDLEMEEIGDGGCTGDDAYDAKVCWIAFAEDDGDWLGGC